MAKRVTGSTYYIAEDPNQPSAVLDWLRRQDDALEEHPKEGGFLLYLRGAGQLGRNANGEFDVTLSPLVTVIPPKVRRRTLWTVGEVHFLTKNLRSAFPVLEGIRRHFEEWLRSHPQIFDQGAQGDHDYYLEGSIKNIAPKVYALPSALEALESGRYFVADGDNDFVLDKLCSRLRLRGLECG